MDKIIIEIPVGLTIGVYVLYGSYKTSYMLLFKESCRSLLYNNIEVFREKCTYMFENDEYGDIVKNMYFYDKSHINYIHMEYIGKENVERFKLKLKLVA